MTATYVFCELISQTVLLFILATLRIRLNNVDTIELYVFSDSTVYLKVVVGFTEEKIVVALNFNLHPKLVKTNRLKRFLIYRNSCALDPLLKSITDHFFRIFPREKKCLS